MAVSEHLTQLLAHTDIINTPVSLHGFLCCSLSQPKSSEAASTNQDSYAIIKKLSKRTSTKEMAALREFAMSIQQQLYNDDLNLALPDELNKNTTIQSTMQVLDEWIDGFNFAYAHFQKVKEWQTNTDIREWLKDLANIQHCCQQHAKKAIDDLDEAEENALYLMEITEFIRTGVYLCKAIWQQKLN